MPPGTGAKPAAKGWLNWEVAAPALQISGQSRAEVDFSPGASHLCRMIEINWGKPLHLVITEKGDVQKFSTIEQAQHWLQAKWPVSDEARQAALQKIEDAMQCIGSVGTARRGFLQAAASAGFALSPVEA